MAEPARNLESLNPLPPENNSNHQLELLPNTEIPAPVDYSEIKLEPRPIGPTFSEAIKADWEQTKTDVLKIGQAIASVWRRATGQPSPEAITPTGVRKNKAEWMKEQGMSNPEIQHALLAEDILMAEQYLLVMRSDNETSTNRDPKSPENQQLTQLESQIGKLKENYTKLEADTVRTWTKELLKELPAGVRDSIVVPEDIKEWIGLLDKKTVRNRSNELITPDILDSLKKFLSTKALGALLSKRWLASSTLGTDSSGYPSWFWSGEMKNLARLQHFIDLVVPVSEQPRPVLELMEEPLPEEEDNTINNEPALLSVDQLKKTYNPQGASGRGKSKNGILNWPNEKVATEQKIGQQSILNQLNKGDRIIPDNIIELLRISNNNQGAIRFFDRLRGGKIQRGEIVRVTDQNNKSHEEFQFYYLPVGSKTGDRLMGFRISTAEQLERFAKALGIEAEPITTIPEPENQENKPTVPDFSRAQSFAELYAAIQTAGVVEGSRGYSDTAAELIKKIDDVRDTWAQFVNARGDAFTIDELDASTITRSGGLRETVKRLFLTALVKERATDTTDEEVSVATPEDHPQNNQLEETPQPLEEVVENNVEPENNIDLLEEGNRLTGKIIPRFRGNPLLRSLFNESGSMVIDLDETGKNSYALKIRRQNGNIIQVSLSRKQLRAFIENMQS